MAMAVLDAKGRFTIPREVREALGLKPGEGIFYGVEDGELHVRKAEDPYDGDGAYLEEALLKELREGRLHRLEDVAARRGVKLRGSRGTRQ